MDSFLEASSARRRDLCEQAGEQLGLPAASVEKDCWICWTLRELFALPESGPHLTFKGGTSLSKGWRLIERFSEDLDLVIDRKYLGFVGDRAPEQAEIRGKERERRLDALANACRDHIEEVLQPTLAARARTRLGESGWSLERELDDEQGQSLLFTYPSAFAEGGYVSPVVKIELGARSDIEPAEWTKIEAYLHEALPSIRGLDSFKVRAITPERTFWEKTMLLHEETYRAPGKGPKARLARHYYDLWCLIGAGVARKALADRDLFEAVAAHRVVFFRRPEAQKALAAGSLRLLPAGDQRGAWKRDYDAMREAMIFGETPSFEEILTRVAEFEREFNATE